jgi:hypothetical protein
MTMYPLLWILAGIAAFATAALFVMFLWNWLIPQLFKGPAIRYKHAIGLMLLSFLLFGGFRGRGHWGGHCAWGHHDGEHACWHNGHDDTKQEHNAPDKSN